MAASTPKDSAAVMVTSAASLGVLQISIRECCRRISRYSGIYRPAWRINHTGVTGTGRALQAFTNFDSGADICSQCSISRAGQRSRGLAESSLGSVFGTAAVVLLPSLLAL